jgi:phage tail tape-measure protein
MNGLFVLAALVAGAGLAYVLTRPKPKSPVEQVGGAIGGLADQLLDHVGDWFGDDDDEDAGNPVGAQSNMPTSSASARYVDMTTEPTVSTTVSARVFSPQPMELYDV